MQLRFTGWQIDSSEVAPWLHVARYCFVGTHGFQSHFMALVTKARPCSTCSTGRCQATSFLLSRLYRLPGREEIARFWISGLQTALRPLATPATKEPSRTTLNLRFYSAYDYVCFRQQPLPALRVPSLSQFSLMRPSLPSFCLRILRTCQSSVRPRQKPKLHVALRVPQMLPCIFFRLPVYQCVNGDL